MKNESNDQFFTFLDTCKYLNVTQGFLRKQVFLNKIPHYKFGRLLRFSKSELQEWISNNHKGVQ